METKKLLSALSIVKPGLSNKELLEQSSSFAFIDDRVVTYNDEISVSHPVEGLALTGAVKAEELYQFLNRVKTEEIEIALNKKGTEVNITAGKSKVSLSIEAEVKLDLSELQKKKKWKKLTPTFLDDIKFVAKAASKDQSTPALTCINIREDGILETTDSYRICRCYGDEQDPFLLPADVVPTILSVKPTKLCIEKNWVHFKTPAGTILSCRVFNAKFHDIDPFFGDTMEWGKEFQFGPDIIEVVDRAMVFSKREHSYDEFLYITISKGKIKVQAHSEYARFEEEAEMKYKGAELKFKIIPHLFLDIIKEKETVVSINSNLLKFEASNWKYIAVLAEFE